MTRSQQGSESTVFIVQNEDESYREPDDRMLKHLELSDAWKRGRRIIQEMEEQNERARQAMEKQEKDDVEAMSKERFKAHARDVNEKLGATNIPKEDLQAHLDHAVESRASDGGRVGTRKVG